jgi:hypothetical protein
MVNQPWLYIWVANFEGDEAASLLTAFPHTNHLRTEQESPGPYRFTDIRGEGSQKVRRGKHEFGWDFKAHPRSMLLLRYYLVHYSALYQHDMTGHLTSLSL